MHPRQIPQGADLKQSGPCCRPYSALTVLLTWMELLISACIPPWPHTEHYAVQVLDTLLARVAHMAVQVHTAWQAASSAEGGSERQELARHIAQEADGQLDCICTLAADLLDDRCTDLSLGHHLACARRWRRRLSCQICSAELLC